MFLKLIKAERIKLRRSPLWIAFIIVPIIPALLGTLNYAYNIEILQSEWYSLWTQHTLFTDYFFLPILIGVYCSYMMRLENRNHNWNKILTMPVPRSMIFLSKLFTASSMVLLSQIWIVILFIISGKAVGMSTVPPVGSITIWCIFGTLGGIVMAAVQLMLCLFIKSFALPIGIALCGGVSGLYFLAKHLGNIWPYSLMAYGMNSNSPQQLYERGYISFIVTCIIYVSVFTFISNIIFAKKDY